MWGQTKSQVGPYDENSGRDTKDDDLKNLMVNGSRRSPGSKPNYIDPKASFTGPFKQVDKEVFELQNLYRTNPDACI